MTDAAATRYPHVGGPDGKPLVSSVPAIRPLDLPPPRMEGGAPMMQALKHRHSTREFSTQSLPARVLCDLLWAAFGVNRRNGDRTAPYWRHVMVMDIYLATEDGVWLFEPKTHQLLPHLDRAIRAYAGIQDFVATAPVNLIYVAHGDRMTDVCVDERRLYATADTAFIGQNVYLFCASEGLATVSAARSIIRSSPAPCIFPTSSSSLLRRRWDTPAPDPAEVLGAGRSVASRVSSFRGSSPGSATR